MITWKKMSGIMTFLLCTSFFSFSKPQTKTRKMEGRKSVLPALIRNQANAFYLFFFVFERLAL